MYLNPDFLIEYPLRLRLVTCEVSNRAIEQSTNGHVVVNLDFF